MRLDQQQSKMLNSYEKDDDKPSGIEGTLRNSEWNTCTYLTPSYSGLTCCQFAIADGLLDDAGHCRCPKKLSHWKAFGEGPFETQSSLEPKRQR